MPLLQEQLCLFIMCILFVAAGGVRWKLHTVANKKHRRRNTTDSEKLHNFQVIDKKEALTMADLFRALQRPEHLDLRVATLTRRDCRAYHLL